MWNLTGSQHIEIYNVHIHYGIGCEESCHGTYWDIYMNTPHIRHFLSVSYSPCTPPLSSLLLSSLPHPSSPFTYQHEWMREYNPVELYDVFMVQRAHRVGFLDELSLYLLLPVQCLHCYGNLYTSVINTYTKSNNITLLLLCLYYIYTYWGFTTPCNSKKWKA